ncbi:MAG: DUF6384 family protein [Pseudomonadota bacterium]
MAEVIEKAAPLDDVMLAMDVVDTLRHREHLVRRELNEKDRETALIERLREIYAGQGIDVPDEILAEGVNALRENRFVYTPPEAGLSVSLASAYVDRGRWFSRIVGIVLALGIGWLAYSWAFVWPEQRQAEALRVEMTETLPGRILALGEAIAENAREDAIRADAAELMADAERALAAGQSDASRKAVSDLQALHDQMMRAYVLTIVSRPGELSGVWRIPDANPNAQNFYLIVEAIAEDGSVLPLPVRSEEDQSVRTVSRFGERVSESVFSRVRADKSDDGIIQNARVAIKQRGFREPEFTIPVLGGRITDW